MNALSIGAPAPWASTSVSLARSEPFQKMAVFMDILAAKLYRDSTCKRIDCRTGKNDRRCKKVSPAARALSAEDRLKVVESLLESLDAPDETIDRLWAKEAEDRLAAYRRGEIEASGLSEVLAKYRAS